MDFMSHGMPPKGQTFAFVATIIASVTLQSVGTVVGIVGGMAGLFALWRVNRVVDPLEAFIKDQQKAVLDHEDAVKQIAADIDTDDLDADPA